MKRLIQRGLLLLLLFAIFAQALSWIAFRSGLALRGLTGREVYQALAEARRPSPAKIVLLGDSVGTQLYTFHGRPRDDIRVLCSNAAISMAGQYEVLLEALRAGVLKDSEVILVYHPDSFRFDIQDHFSFQYFVKPFWLAKWRGDFSPAVAERVRQIPWLFAVYSPTIRYGNWTPDWEGPAHPISKRGARFIRDISAEYLGKMYELSQREGFSLHVIPPLVCETWAADHLDTARFQAEIEELGFQELFGRYVENIPLRPRDWYRDDDIIHLRASKVAELGDDPLHLLERYANSGKGMP